MLDMLGGKEIINPHDLIGCKSAKVQIKTKSAPEDITRSGKWKGNVQNFRRPRDPRSLLPSREGRDLPRASTMLRVISGKR